MYVCWMQYIDRTLERMPLKQNLGPVALACILIGSKFAETHPTSVEDLQCCVPQHTSQDIVAMEAKVMEALDWKLHAITAHHFVQVITSQLSRTSCERVMHYAKLLLNIVDSECSWLCERRSVVALAVVTISLEFVGVWHPHLASYMALVDEPRIDRQRTVLIKLCHARNVAQPLSPYVKPLSEATNTSDSSAID